MWKSLKPATAIALALGLGGCASLESPTSLMGSSSDARTSVFPNKSDIDNQMRLADASMKAGNEAAAISIYRRLAREYPMALKPRLALGEALLAANAPQEAARAFEGALKLKGDSAQARVGLGRVELALHQPAKALEHFERAVKVDAKSTAAHNGRAVALDQLGRHDEAQAVYLDLLAKDPSNIRIRNNYALSLALAGKFDDSADILAGLAAAPDSETRIRQNLALVYGLAGNDGQAAHVARMDLDEAAVNNNLEYYQRLRHSNAKGVALVNPARETLDASERASDAPAKTADVEAQAPIVDVASLGAPARPQRVEYRTPKNAKSNGIASDAAQAPREIAPFPAQALRGEPEPGPLAAAAGETRVAALGGATKAKPAAGHAVEAPRVEARAVESLKVEAEPAKARSDSPASGAAPSAITPKQTQSDVGPQAPTAKSQPAAAQRSAVPAVGPARAATAPMVGAPVAKEPAALVEPVKSGPAQAPAKTASKETLADAWAALEAAPQAPAYKKTSAKRAAKVASSPGDAQPAAGQAPVDIAPTAMATSPSLGAQPADTKAAREAESKREPSTRAPAAPRKSEAAPSGTTAETNALKSAPLESEPLAATTKQAAPAVPPVASAGEGVSGSIRPAMKLRPSSGAALHAPAVPKLRFKDEKAEIDRQAAVPKKG